MSGPQECEQALVERGFDCVSAAPGPDECETDCQAANWYAIYTRHQHEKAVAHHLDQMGFNVFLPLYRETHQWHDRRKRVSIPLFPCYVFFSGDLERKYQILNTPGVCSLVTYGHKAAIVSPAELNAVRRMIESPLPVEQHPFLQYGDRARVVSGPLVGIEGIVVRRRDSLRIVLSVEMLQQSVAVEVDQALLEFATCK